MIFRYIWAKLKHNVHMKLGTLYLFYSRPCILSTIEPTVAVQTFRSQRGLVLSLFRHCLISLADSLYASSIISQEVYDRACNEYIGRNQRCAALLDCVEARVGLVPLHGLQ